MAASDAEELRRRGNLALKRLSRHPEASGLLLEAARRQAEGNVREARDAYLDALVAAIYAGPAGTGGSVFAAAQALGAPPVPPSESTASDLLLDGLVELYTTGHAEAVPTLRRAVEAFRGESDVRWLPLMAACHVAVELWDDEALPALSRRLVELTNADAPVAGGELAPAGALVVQGCVTDVFLGRFQAAESSIAEASEIFAALGLRLDFDRAGATLLHVAAWRGREKDAYALADEMMRSIQASGQSAQVWDSYIHYATAVLELGFGRYEAALAQAQAAIEHPTFLWPTSALPDLVEAAVRCGENEIAVTALRRLADSTTASGTPWARGMLARSRALIEANAEAEPLYQEAIEHLSGCLVVPQLARTRLLYGEWLRRRRRRRDARAQLAAAYEMFASIGAEAFAHRTSIEFAATGARAGPRMRTVPPLETLTPYEIRIGRSVAEGASDADIAVILAISPCALEYHLGPIYRKVGVESRTQLAAVFRKRG